MLYTPLCVSVLPMYVVLQVYWALDSRYMLYTPLCVSVLGAAGVLGFTLQLCAPFCVPVLPLDVVVQMCCEVAFCRLYTAVVYTFLCFCPSPWRGAAGVLVCSLVLAVSGFYSARDDVVELNPSNFNQEVIQSDSLWLIEFYAPWWAHLCVTLLSDRHHNHTIKQSYVNVPNLLANKLVLSHPVHIFYVLALCPLRL